MHVCVSKLIIGRRQGIIWNTAGTLLFWPWGIYFSKILIEIHIFFIQTNAFKNVFCDMAIIYWSQRINSLRPSDAYVRQ